MYMQGERESKKNRKKMFYQVDLTYRSLTRLALAEIVSNNLFASGGITLPDENQPQVFMFISVNQHGYRPI